jgi:hypothetical protein
MASSAWRSKPARLPRAEHAAFADRCMPLLAPAQGEPGQIRSALLEQLRVARQIVTAGGLGYLKALAGKPMAGRY